MKLDPRNDGIDHINVYSKGKTEIGRWLSNFTYAPITTEDGKFNSIEGYWYWLSTKDDSLRKLSGFAAKKKGRELKGEDWLTSKDFKHKIRKAIHNKLCSYPNMMDIFLKTELPIVHYYVFKDKVVVPKEGKWLMDFLEEYRESAIE